MREILKMTVERALLASGIPGVRRRVGRGMAVVLGYHNVVPAGTGHLGDSSLHMPLDEFQRQLDLLEEHFEVVSLSSLLDEGSSRDRPAAAVTFDDAYRGCLELGVAEVASRGLPCTIFVPPGLLGRGGFWWDCFAETPYLGLEPSFRDYALKNLGGRQATILHWASANGRQPETLPELLQPATEEELLAAVTTPGLTLGSHTWTHVNLATVPLKEAEAELDRPLAWLERLGASERSVSYPYGAWSPQVADAAGRAGYGRGLLVQGGLTRVSEMRKTPLAIPRINVPRGISPDGFLLRVSGVWPR